MHARRIAICFDGTLNDPDDGLDIGGEHGVVPDQSISNVLKLHLLVGGTLENTPPPPDVEQLAFYYLGVGNRAVTKLFGKLSAALAITEPKRILEEATRDLTAHYRPGDSLYVFGFSRGAAIARQFAQHLSEAGLTVGDREVHPPICFLGLWDTVAAFGGPNLDSDRRPHTRELNERDGKVAPNVEEAYHLVSIDEPRIAFRPTLMGAEPRVHEIWFAGVHSDIGGGYLDDGLSDTTLAFMLARAKEAKLHVKEVDEVETAMGGIAIKRLTIDPDPFGTLHFDHLIAQNAYKTWLNRWKNVLALREIQVSEDDRIIDRPPRIHHSALTRRDRAELNYAPPEIDALAGRYDVEKRD